MRKLLFPVLSFLVLCPLLVMAEQTDEYQEGFLTSYLNRAIEKGMEVSSRGDLEGAEPLHYGRNVTKYVSAPQFGGYVIGKYSYSTKCNIIMSTTARPATTTITNYGLKRT